MTESGLGPLTDLPGTWIGEGLSVVTSPGHEGHPPSAPQVAKTHEAIAFAQIGGFDTGAGGAAGRLLGVYYAHHATDAPSGAPLFVEPGIWMTTPAGPGSEAEAGLVRLATLPHGHAVLAAGSSTTVDRAPEIPVAGAAPIDLATARPLTVEGRVTAGTAEEPAGLRGATEDANKLLRSRIECQRITTTTIITIAGGPGTEKQLSDMPFSVENPRSLSLQATFWIETVADDQKPGGNLLQLQYSQTVLLSLDGVGWPSVNCATLVKR
jgi:hypothetical protein